MWYRHWTLLAFLALTTAGCGGSDGSPSGQPSSDLGNHRSASADPDGPAGAVFQFLEAVRRGDDEKAATMFTVTAQEKAAEMNIQVAPPGSDTASFQVGQVEYVSEDVAKVASRWTDADGEGAFRTDEMDWMLRRGPDGWRVAGMAAVVFEGEPPLLLDFENPQETLRKLELLREEIGRRSGGEDVHAQSPRNSQDSVRR